jgi:hypothetical protein
METHLTKEELETLARRLGLKTNVAVSGLEIALSHIVVLDKKQQDYGPHNISKFGLAGLLVRINDKFERLCNLIQNKLDPENEPIEDSFLDLSNYAVIGRLIRQGKWGGGDYNYPPSKLTKPEGAR